MGKNRRIPFGYVMIKGDIKADPVEISAVIKVFNEYIAGNGLTAIAKMLEADGIPYYKGEPAAWNKNMVKRIIENKRYIGDETYPQIIDAAIFKRANDEKEKKANNICLVPDNMAELRSIIRCAECGGRLFRNRNDTWNCKSPSCRRFSYIVTDQMIESAVLNMLNTAAANPSLVDAEGEMSIYSPSGAVLKQKNEIDRLMDTGRIDYDTVKSAMMKLAKIKYQCCSYNDVPQMTSRIKTLLAERGQLDELDNDLITKIVRQITVSHYAEIGLELINGVRLKNITEKGETGNE